MCASGLNQEPVGTDEEVLEQYKHRAFVYLYWSMAFYSYATGRIDKISRTPLISKKEGWIFPAELLKAASKYCANEVPLFDGIEWKVTDREKQTLKTYVA
jgi:hypothetical protein